MKRQQIVSDPSHTRNPVSEIPVSTYRKWNKNTVNELKREAALLSRISCPGVPRLIRFADSGKEAYLEMEYIDGIPIAEALPKQRMDREEAVLLYMQQLAQILKYLHGMDPPIYHLDIKPDNLLISQNKLYLIDFGIALQAGEQMRRGVGTKGYAPPEQFQGIADQRSDLYAFGRTMADLLGRAAEKEPYCELIGALTCEEITKRISSVEILLCKLIEVKALRKKRERQRQAARRNRILLAGLTAVLMLLVIGVSYRQWKAETEKKQVIFLQALALLAEEDREDLPQIMSLLEQVGTQEAEAVHALCELDASEEADGQVLLGQLQIAAAYLPDQAIQQDLLLFMTGIMYRHQEAFREEETAIEAEALLYVMEGYAETDEISRRIEICRVVIGRE